MPSKYRNIPTAVDGILFASKREANRYSELKLLERTQYISDLELQKEFELKVNGVKVCTYRCDFFYKDRQGREVVEDVKSEVTRANRAYRIKCKLMIACHGIRVLET